MEFINCETDVEDSVSEDEDLQQMELEEMIVRIILLMMQVLQMKIQIFELNCYLSIDMTRAYRVTTYWKGRPTKVEHLTAVECYYFSKGFLIKKDW